MQPGPGGTQVRTSEFEKRFLDLDNRMWAPTFQDDGLLESLCFTSRWDALTFMAGFCSASLRRFSAARQVGGRR